MYIDNMTNATVTCSPTNAGFNLIEMNHANSNGGYYDDLTFRAANDPWIVEQPASLSASPGQSAYFTTVAVGTGYQWQFNGRQHQWRDHLRLQHRLGGGHQFRQLRLRHHRDQRHPHHQPGRFDRDRAAGHRGATRQPDRHPKPERSFQRHASAPRL